jgi:cation transport ATPase
MSQSDNLLNRPIEQRLLEYKYRCAQAVVFGLPVLGLQWFGKSLGGAPGESMRWIAVLQALLAGWVTYVSAAGMLAEGVMLLVGSGKRVIADLPVALAAIALYLYSAISVLGVFMRGAPFYRPLLFHVVVLLLAIWCGWRWWRLRSPNSNFGR